MDKLGSQRWHHSPRLRQWEPSQASEERSDVITPPNTVLFLEVSGFQKASTPLGSPAPCLSPACSVN